MHMEYGNDMKKIFHCIGHYSEKKYPLTKYILSMQDPREKRDLLY